MPIIVDTYNVLHTTGVLPPELAGVDVPGLIGLIHRSRYSKDRVELICDGVPRPDVPAGKVGAVIIRYAGGPAGSGGADALIAARVRYSSAPRRLTVVSSDQEVLRAARKRKCRTLTSAQFLDHLAADAGSQSRSPNAPADASKPSSGLSNRQIEAWLSIFNVDENDTAEAADEADLPESAPAKSARPGKKSRTPKRGRSTREVMPRDIIREAEELWARNAGAKDRRPQDLDSDQHRNDNDRP